MNTQQSLDPQQVTPAAQPTPTQHKFFGYNFLSFFGSWLFLLSLVGLAVATAGAMTFGSSEATKNALRESGAYEQATTQLADRVSQEATDTAGPTLESESVYSAAQTSISASMIQRDAEGAIDSTYDWLQGKTEKLQVSVDLRPYINSFLGRLGDQALQKTASLPACTPQQLQQLDPNNINIFNLPCRPPGVDPNTIKDQTIAQLTNSNDLLRNPVLDTTKLPKDAQGQTAVDRASYLPQTFQWTMVLPWIFGATLFLSGLLLIGLGWSCLQQTIRRLAGSVLGAGITVLIIVAIVKLLFWYMAKPDSAFSKLIEGDFSEVILSFAQSLEKVYNGKLLAFGIIYAVIGAAVIIGLRFLKKHTSREAVEVTASTDTKKSPTQL